jgi:hypothetical protein
MRRSFILPLCFLITALSFRQYSPLITFSESSSLPVGIEQPGPPSKYRLSLGGGFFVAAQSVQNPFSF